MHCTDIDLLSPEAIRDPAAAFRRMRERSSVVWNTRHKVFVLTGHAEVYDAFRDRSLSSARAMASFRQALAGRHHDALARALELLDGWMLLNDPPDHARLRDPVRRAFTPAVAAALEPRIHARVDALIDAFGDTVDIAADFAHPLTAMVICDLLGVEDEHRDFLRGWTKDFAKLIYGASSRAPDYVAAVARAGEMFHARLTPLLARRRAEPRDDLVSRLVASSEADGWTESELLGAISMLLFAGHDTTSALITSSVRALATHAEARTRFIEEPALAESAIEELLRFDGPSKTFVRVATETHERGGTVIEAGRHLWLAILAANHDPRVFDAPEALVLDREPNPHVSFGGGMHFCLGAALARVEARIALTRLFERHPGLHLTAHPPAWSPTVVDRSLLALPVALAA